MKSFPHIITTCVLLTVPGAVAVAQEPSAAERVAALKGTQAASQVVLKQYEWIETTIVSVKDEEKSRQVNRCYYGADGGVAKVPLTAPAPEAKKRGLRGRIAENKKEEMTDYMKQAVALVKSYVPPTPGLLQSAKEKGKVSVELVEPGKRARLNFRDYLKPGDTLSADVDLTSNRLLSLTVKTYLEGPADAVSLNANFGKLADGTAYPDTITLRAPAKNLQVRVDNSGYRKTGQ